MYASRYIDILLRKQQLIEMRKRTIPLFIYFISCISMNIDYFCRCQIIQLKNVHLHIKIKIINLLSTGDANSRPDVLRPE